MQAIEVINILLSKEDIATKMDVLEYFCQQGCVPIHFLNSGNYFEKVRQEIDIELIEIAQFVKFKLQYKA